MNEDIKVITNTSNIETKESTNEVETLDTDTLIEIEWIKRNRLNCLAY